MAPAGSEEQSVSAAAPDFDSVLTIWGVRHEHLDICVQGGNISRLGSFVLNPTRLEKHRTSEQRDNSSRGIARFMGGTLEDIL